MRKKMLRERCDDGVGNRKYSPKRNTTIQDLFQRIQVGKEGRSK